MADDELPEQLEAMGIARAGETPKRIVIRHILNLEQGATLTSATIPGLPADLSTNAIQLALRELRITKVLRVIDSGTMHVIENRATFAKMIQKLRKPLREIGNYIYRNYTKTNPGQSFSLEDVAFSGDGGYNFLLVEQTVIELKLEGAIASDDNRPMTQYMLA